MSETRRQRMVMAHDDPVSGAGPNERRRQDVDIQEARRFFEQLLSLRLAYRHRGAWDREVEMTIAEVLTWAEDRLAQLEQLEPTATDAATAREG